MKSLIIETTTEEGLTAISSFQEILYQGDIPKGFQQSRYLIPEIERGLKSTGLSLKDLSFIAVGVGPGSYTGIRVGAMVAKTFSWVTGVPLVPISYLEGIAPLEDGPFIAALDAKISGVYALFGEKKEGGITFLGPPQVISLENLPEGYTIYTPHAAALAKKCRSRIFIERFADISLLVKTACDRFAQGVTANDRTLELQYLREWCPS